jgi:DNA-binding MarR family transcriptional regulator
VRAAIDTCAGWASRLAARRITNFLEERMQGSGLSLAQFGLIARIAAAPDDTLGALAERTGLDQSTLSRNLRGLEAAGLIEIAIVEDDQRRRAVWLTEEGARRLEAALPVWREAHAALAERLDPRLALRLGAASEELAGG